MTESASTPAAREVPAHVALLQMITARWISQAISAAAKLNVADQLAAGPRTIAELAAATRTDAPSLYRLLRALASVGIFAEVDATPHTELAARRFSLTPLAEPLRSAAPHSMYGAALMIGEEWQVRAWADLYRSVQTGETAFNRVFGMPFFDFLSSHPEALETFFFAMKSFTAVSQDAIVAAADFSGIETLIDVGGGNATLLAAILKANPSLRGVLYDTDKVVATARPVLDAAGVANRCTILTGDFFASVPARGDACLMKHIIHDWDDAHSVTILSNCRRALPAHGKLFVVEAVIGPGNAPEFGKLLDLEMLVDAPGGRERTQDEFQKLFAASGFRLARVVPTASPFAILEALPAS
jgi:hypothetical protein